MQDTVRKKNDLLKMKFLYPSSGIPKVLKENEPSIQYYGNPDSFVSYVDFEPIMNTANMHLDSSRQYEQFR